MKLFKLFLALLLPAVLFMACSSSQTAPDGEYFQITKSDGSVLYTKAYGFENNPMDAQGDDVLVFTDILGMKQTVFEDGLVSISGPVAMDSVSAAQKQLLRLPRAENGGHTTSDRYRVIPHLGNTDSQLEVVQNQRLRRLERQLKDQDSLLRLYRMENSVLDSSSGSNSDNNDTIWTSRDTLERVLNVRWRSKSDSIYWDSLMTSRSIKEKDSSRRQSSVSTVDTSSMCDSSISNDASKVSSSESIVLSFLIPFFAFLVGLLLGIYLDRRIS